MHADDAALTDRHVVGHAPARRLPGHGKTLDIDPATAERSLVSLVLTVVELLRQLMERQAIRRFDQGDLTGQQVEQVGATLMALEQRMGELCDYFELTPEDLNLDLGPLGPLLPRDLPTAAGSARMAPFAGPRVNAWRRIRCLGPPPGAAAACRRARLEPG